MPALPFLARPVGLAKGSAPMVTAPIAAKTAAAAGPTLGAIREFSHWKLFRCSCA